MGVKGLTIDKSVSGPKSIMLHEGLRYIPIPYTGLPLKNYVINFLLEVSN